MYFASISETVGTLSALLVCGLVLWKGGTPERWASGLILFTWLATPVVQDRINLSQIQYSVFIMDSVLTAALLAIAATSNRYWPLWVAAFQILEILMHVAMLIDHKVHARAYFVGIEILSYLILAALAVGTWLEAPRLQHVMPTRIIP